MAAAESLYVYGKIESFLFCEALSLGKNIICIKPSSLLRSSSSSTSLNVIFQQTINEDSLAHSCCLAVITLQILNLSGVPDPSRCIGPLQRCSVPSALPGLQRLSAPCPAQQVHASKQLPRRMNLHKTQKTREIMMFIGMFCLN